MDSSFLPVTGCWVDDTPALFHSDCSWHHQPLLEGPPLVLHLPKLRAGSRFMCPVYWLEILAMLSLPLSALFTLLCSRDSDALLLHSTHPMPQSLPSIAKSTYYCFFSPRMRMDYNTVGQSRHRYSASHFRLFFPNNFVVSKSTMPFVSLKHPWQDEPRPHEHLHPPTASPRPTGAFPLPPKQSKDMASSPDAP
jgi:hypothetical protein